MSDTTLALDTTRDEHVATALRGMIEACGTRDHERFSDHLADLVTTPGDGTYPSYEVAIYAKAVARLRDSAAAEDVVAEAVLRITRTALRTFEAGGVAGPGHLDLERLVGSPSPAAAVGKYLSRIGENLVVDRLRARSRDVDLLARLHDTVAEPADHDELAELHHALRRLDPAQQRLLRLVFVEGRSQSDVAGALGVSRPTIHNRLATATQALRTLMSD